MRKLPTRLACRVLPKISPIYMMASSQIRQSFLDFFKSKRHTIVPSSSLMPDSPNLLFTNAGMNQFVPIFLGQTKCPYTPGRAADTQKCIRAGGKHNDLEDVGLDTYHHTFFEMLGNWSFGDYFKEEAIKWAWELVAVNWKFPPSRLYATVFCPYLGQPGWEEKWNADFDLAQRRLSSKQAQLTEEVATFDESAADIDAIRFWMQQFQHARLDPRAHIVPGNKKDNFWMMGETGPCGPCSELHVDLTPAGDTKGALVNKGDARCIEIWNLVFIQFNANPDGTFSPLPASHVDTGMGFERVASIIQGTQKFTDFANAKISNYETDIFRPIFDALEKLSGKKYGSTLPAVGQASRLSQTSEKDSGKIDGDRRDACPTPEQIATDIAFRVIADHIRTLSFAIADGIQPGNNDRNYVLRRILRRAVRYGRTLGFKEPFFYKLVDVLADTMGDVFPEIRARKKQVQETIRIEEEAFNKTLDNGIAIFEGSVFELNTLKDFLKGIPSKLHRVRQELDSIPDAFPIPVAHLESAWAWFLTEVSDRLISKEFIQRMQADIEKVSTVGILAKLVTLNWNSGSWKKYCEPVNSQYRDLQGLGNSPKKFEECRANIRQELKTLEDSLPVLARTLDIFPDDVAFKLYDTYGFPLDLTELMARERGLTVDKDGFEKLMDEQRARARAAQKKEIISLSQIETTTPTKFVGYEKLETAAKVLEVVSLKSKVGVQASACSPDSLKAGLQLAVILETSACYAEMGGQVGDTGELVEGENLWRVTNTQKSGNTWLHFLDAVEQASGLSASASRRSAGGETPPATAGTAVPPVGSIVSLSVDVSRRNAIQRHHTVTHLLHWALHEVANRDASQKGSFVGPDKLTFDFNSAPLTPQQVADIEKLVNERILENAGVSWTEVPYADVKSRKDVMQFFGDKYGDTVRVVQIGGHAARLDGYSMELCGGTHTRATGEIGLFRIVGENAIAAGVRRIEAVAGLEAYRKANDELHLIRMLAGKVNSPVHELDKKIEALLAHQKELEKQLKTAQQREASNAASLLLEEVKVINGIPVIVHNLGAASGDFLQAIADSLKGRFKGVIILGGVASDAVALLAAVSPEFVKNVQAGKIIQQIAPIVGGKGGGKPDNARGGGKDAGKLDEALAKAKALLG
jgi:alanyl-tRNA synthetase